MNDVDIDIVPDILLDSESLEVVNAWMKKNEMECQSLGLIGKNPVVRNDHHDGPRYINSGTGTCFHESRIPDMDIGTPLENAIRRDLYAKVLSYRHYRPSPLLQIVRANRFASRLNYLFDKKISEAHMHPHVDEALDKKVSRERIYSEFNGIMLRDLPTHALGLLVKLGLFNLVFQSPTDGKWT